MRVLNRLLATVLALGLLVGGLVVALEVVLTGITRHPVLLRYRGGLADLRRHAWNDSVVRVVAVVVIVVTVLLLLAELLPSRPPQVEGSGPAGYRVTFARRPLERALGRLARRQSGIDKATVKVRRRKVIVKARTITSDVSAARAALDSAMSDGVGRLPLQRTPKVKVSLRRSDS